MSCVKLFFKFTGSSFLNLSGFRIINRTIREPIDCALMISVMGNKLDYQIMWYFTENISKGYQLVLIYWFSFNLLKKKMPEFS